MQRVADTTCGNSKYGYLLLLTQTLTETLLTDVLQVYRLLSFPRALSCFRTALSFH